MTYKTLQKQKIKYTNNIQFQSTYGKSDKFQYWFISESTE